MKGSEYRPTVPEPQPVGQAETRDQLLPDISEIDLREQYLVEHPPTARLPPTEGQDPGPAGRRPGRPPV